MTEIIEFEGRKFLSLDFLPTSTWLCPINNQHPIPTLTLKNDDIFFITDTLGNIEHTDCSDNSVMKSMGLFCRDTRYLNHLTLLIDKQAPVLLSSTAQKGFFLSILATNPNLINLESGEKIATETISIQREIAIKGGLFEEITLHNYNSFPVSFTLSVSFGADFLDIFDVRGFGRESRGNLLQFSGYYINELIHTENHPEIILAYQGKDGIILESRIQFHSLLPDAIEDYTAICNVQIEARQQVTLGYKIF